jgi:hypothetical protein
MNRFIASIAGLALMAVANVAAADCISTCENNCLSLGDPGAIGVCISNCPAECALPLPPCDVLPANVTNHCTLNSPIVVTPSANQFTISKEGTDTSATGFITLVCSNFGRLTTVFQQGQTITGTQRVGVECVNSRGENVGNPFQSSCGPTNQCSGGVN